VTRRHPPLVLGLWTVAGLLLLLAAGLFGYGRFGGASPTPDQPFRWDGTHPLVISHHAGFAAPSVCRVRPAVGEPRTFEVSRTSSGSLIIQVEQPWFDGSAEVTCERAKLLAGPLAPFVDQWFTAVLLALVVALVSAPLEKRHRRRHPDGSAADERRQSGGPATVAGSRPADGASSSVVVVDAHNVLPRGGLLLALSRPCIVVDGHRHAGRWGRNELSVPPGRHRVEVWVPYPLPRRRGPAEVEVDVPAGATVELEYRVPLWPFLRGSLGPPPQNHRGAGVTLLVAGLAALALCASLTWLGLSGR